MAPDPKVNQGIERMGRVAIATQGVLYVVVCAAPPASGVGEFVAVSAYPSSPPTKV